MRRRRPHGPTSFAVLPVAPKAADVAESFESAFEATLLTLLAPILEAPVYEQVRWHFGIGVDGVRRSKRLRPRALLAVALAEGGTFSGALDAAIAVEVLHNYSLVHDDIEDGDRYRHGREAVWSRYGLRHGINAGDALSALLSLALLRNTAGASSEHLTQRCGVLQRAHLLMCAGQSLDLAFENASAVSLEAYWSMIGGKTASLFGAACELGARCAGVPEARATAYASAGRAFGRAFQIRDDVAGIWSASDTTGKAARGDIARRKWSFPIVWALSGPPSAAQALIASSYGAGAELAADDVAAVVAALDALDARAAACQAYEREVEFAESTLERYGIDRDGSLRAIMTPAIAPLR